MAAPRQYSDAQRAAMFRLYEAGKTPAEIARLCEEGTAGVSPFQIPRRTCHDIVTRMAEEAERKIPTSVAEAESAEAVERFPARIARLVDAEIDRLAAKQEKHGLAPGDYDRLSRATDLSFALEKRLRQRQPTIRRGGRGTREGTGSQPAEETALERLAREQQKRDGAEEQATPTRTCRDEADPDAERPASGPGPVSPAPASTSHDEPSVDPAQVKPQTPRELAAQRARAALTAA